MSTTHTKSEKEADGTLLISLAGVAELAGVRRPVASMWRSRFRTGAQPFPEAVARRGSSDLFDAEEVAAWLEGTGHGHNPAARADAAASGAPFEWEVTDPDHRAELEALIALRAGASVELAGADLRRLAREVDPGDVYLRSEIERHASSSTSWAAFADALVDASFAPAAALDALASRAARTSAADASAGSLRTPVVDLVAELVAALAGSAGIRLASGVTSDVLRGVIDHTGEHADLIWPEGDAGRALRRRAAAAGVPIFDAERADTAVTLARVPAVAGGSAVDTMMDVESLVLDLAAGESAVIVGPARLLTDSLSGPAERIRADILRTGRLRAIVRLPEGLVISAAREALAVWVVGAAHEVAIAERLTAVADLTGIRLSTAAIRDLISDITVTVDGSHLMAHAYRFARVVRTSSLLAQHTGLVGDAAPRARATIDVRELPALLDEAARSIVSAVPTTADVDGPQQRRAILFADAVAQRRVRVVAGVRVADDEVGGEGFALVGPGELADPSSIGNRRVERLAFTARHPNAQLTRPGDVVFCTAPEPWAWVDDEGSHVVAYPARVVRISSSDPGGLIAELVAADIRAGEPGPSAWRRWRLRTVDPEQRAPLRGALRGLAETRTGLERQIADLDRYGALLADAVSARAVRVLSTTNEERHGTHHEAG